MNEFNGTDLSKAFNAGVDAVALECNRRIVNIDEVLTPHIITPKYLEGYKDALSELLEWMEFHMNNKR